MLSEVEVQVEAETVEDEEEDDDSWFDVYGLDEVVAEEQDNGKEGENEKGSGVHGSSGKTKSTTLAQRSSSMGGAFVAFTVGALVSAWLLLKVTSTSGRAEPMTSSAPGHGHRNGYGRLMTVQYE